MVRLLKMMLQILNLVLIRVLGLKSHLWQVPLVLGLLFKFQNHESLILHPIRVLVFRSLVKGPTCEMGYSSWVSPKVPDLRSYFLDILLQFCKSQSCSQFLPLDFKQSLDLVMTCYWRWVILPAFVLSPTFLQHSNV